jgi:hypothetical protein
VIEPDEIAYAAAWERVLEKNSDPRAFVEASKGDLRLFISQALFDVTASFFPHF